MPMATLTKNWNVGGGAATITYTGQGDGTISIKADVNEGVDRTMQLTVTAGSVSKSLTVNQVGKREYFNSKTASGVEVFACKDGSEFLTLKG